MAAEGEEGGGACYGTRGGKIEVGKRWREARNTLRRTRDGKTLIGEGDWVVGGATGLGEEGGGDGSASSRGRQGEQCVERAGADSMGAMVQAETRHRR